MFSSVPRIARLPAATSLALASLATAAHAQTGAQGRPDATNVQMATVSQTYCRSIDNVDMTSHNFYTNAADVAAKEGKVIQSHNGGSCCTAASPWNGTMCAAPLVCGAGTEAVNGVCVATNASCAAIGMTLINGSCAVAAPPPPCFTAQPSSGIYGTNKTANYLEMDSLIWGINPLYSYVPGGSFSISAGTANKSGVWFPSDYTNVDYARPFSFNIFITGVQNITGARYSPSVWFSKNVVSVINNNKYITAPNGPNGSSAEIYVNDQLAGRTVYGLSSGTDTVANTILPKLKEGDNKITFFLKGSVVGENQDGWTYYYQSEYTGSLVLLGNRCK